MGGETASWGEHDRRPSSLSVLPPAGPLKVIVDNVLKGKPVDVPGLTFIDGLSTNGLLYAAIVAFVAIYVLGALSDYLATWLMDSTGVRLVADIRETLFARLQRLSLRFHSRQRSGDLMARLMSDTNRMQDMLVQSFSVLIPNVVLLVGITVVMFLIDWVFTLVALAVSPLLFLIVFSYTTRIKAASRRARRREGRLAARSGEVLGAVRVVQAFTQEDFEDRRFSRRSARVAAANLEATRLQAQFSPLVDILTGVGTALVLLVGTRRVLSGELTLGLLLVFLSYLRSLYRPMRQLSKLSYVSSKGFASAERISEILEAERDVDDVPDAPAAPRLRGEVRFDAVEFGYGERPVLSDIDLVVSPGEVIAIVGPTGAGKSTLVSLIPRFFDPARGRVLVDGVDVRSVQLQSLRSQIAIVLQEPILFEGTITQNIAYGRPAASEAEVLRAAEAALVDEFVAGLPDGYDTVVGERGATLSGGERQRISIARALVRSIWPPNGSSSKRLRTSSRLARPSSSPIGCRRSPALTASSSSMADACSKWDRTKSSSPTTRASTVASSSCRSARWLHRGPTSSEPMPAPGPDAGATECSPTLGGNPAWASRSHRFWPPPRPRLGSERVGPAGWSRRCPCPTAAESWRSDTPTTAARSRTGA